MFERAVKAKIRFGDQHPNLKELELVCVDVSFAGSVLSNPPHSRYEMDQKWTSPYRIIKTGWWQT